MQRASNWVALVSPERHRYYWNVETNEVSWTLPEDLRDQPGVSQEAVNYVTVTTRLEALLTAAGNVSAEVMARFYEFKSILLRWASRNWIRVDIDDGRHYFWNKLTKEVSWLLPPGLEGADIDAVTEWEHVACMTKATGEQVEASRNGHRVSISQPQASLLVLGDAELKFAPPAPPHSPSSGNNVIHNNTLATATSTVAPVILASAAPAPAPPSVSAPSIPLASAPNPAPIPATAAPSIPAVSAPSTPVVSARSIPQTAPMAQPSAAELVPITGSIPVPVPVLPSNSSDHPDDGGLAVKHETSQVDSDVNADPDNDQNPLEITELGEVSAVARLPALKSSFELLTWSPTDCAGWCASHGHFSAALNQHNRLLGLFTRNHLDGIAFLSDYRDVSDFVSIGLDGKDAKEMKRLQRKLRNEKRWRSAQGLTPWIHSLGRNFRQYESYIKATNSNGNMNNNNIDGTSHYNFSTVSQSFSSMLSELSETRSGDNNDSVHSLFDTGGHDDNGTGVSGGSSVYALQRAAVSPHRRAILRKLNTLRECLQLPLILSASGSTSAYAATRTNSTELKEEIGRKKSKEVEIRVDRPGGYVQAAVTDMFTWPPLEVGFWCMRNGNFERETLIFYDNAIDATSLLLDYESVNDFTTVGFEGWEARQLLLLAEGLRLQPLLWTKYDTAAWLSSLGGAFNNYRNIALHRELDGRALFLSPTDIEDNTSPAHVLSISHMTSIGVSPPHARTISRVLQQFRLILQGPSSSPNLRRYLSVLEPQPTTVLIHSQHINSPSVVITVPVLSQAAVKGDNNTKLRQNLEPTTTTTSTTSASTTTSTSIASSTATQHLKSESGGVGVGEKKQLRPLILDSSSEDGFVGMGPVTPQKSPRSALTEDEVHKLIVDRLGVRPFGELEFEQQLGRSTYKTHLCGISLVVKKTTEANEREKDHAVHQYVPPHPHIVHYYGVKYHQDSDLAFMRFYSQGSLDRHLRKVRSSITSLPIPGSPLPSPSNTISSGGSGPGGTSGAPISPSAASSSHPTSSLTSEEIIDFALQIALGVRHLHSHFVVHGKLASRAILLSGDTKRVAILAGFGMARRIDPVTGVHTEIGKQGGAKKVHLPFRYMAPEFFTTRKISKQSDVWGFGVVLWELMTQAEHLPFHNLDLNALIATFKSEKAHLLSNVSTKSPLYSLAESCLSYNKDNRPTMDVVCQRLQALKKRRIEEGASLKSSNFWSGWRNREKKKEKSKDEEGDNELKQGEKENTAGQNEGEAKKRKSRKSSAYQMLLGGGSSQPSTPEPKGASPQTGRRNLSVASVADIANQSKPPKTQRKSSAFKVDLTMFNPVKSWRLHKERERQEAENREMGKRNRQLEEDLSQANIADQQISKCLLLGTGESGKTTLMKALQRTYGKDWKVEKARFVFVMWENVFTVVRAIIDAAKYEVFLSSEVSAAFEIWVRESENWEKTIMEYLQLDSSNLIVEKCFYDVAVTISTIWDDQTIRNFLFKRREELQLFSSAHHFLQKITDIAQPGYVLAEIDVAMCRERTSGIVETHLAIDGNVIHFFDVGGQRNERNKWIHCFENVMAVVFVASLSDYDQVLYEDETTNRLHEALNLWEQHVNSEWFCNTAFILLLNKRDIFAQKLKTQGLHVCFPAFTGPQTYDAGVEYIQAEFESRNHQQHDIYTHPICLLEDTDLVMVIFNAIKDIIIKKGLARAGLV